MFEFLSPIFLVGLLSAAIPLLVHLSRSRRTKKIQFSTTRFLTDHFLRSYRMSRLKELLLLAFRMALFALFAMALARPMLLPKGAVWGVGPQLLFPELTPALSDVRQALAGVQPASLGTDLSSAVVRVEDLLRSSAAQSKEIYMLSDPQDSGWEPPGEAAVAGKLGSHVF